MIRKNVEVIQEEKSDCGVSCLLSIIKYYGGMNHLKIYEFLRLLQMKV